MKRAVCLAVLLAISASLTGCFIWVRDCDGPSGKFAPADSAIAEIEAVKLLSNDGARYEVLMALAQRPNLSPQARAHLAESVTMLSNDGARYEVLMALAKNTPVPPQPQPQPMMPQPPHAPPAPQP